ncbi:MAG: hypothetical protein A3F24_02995 [Candidatus Colwellbacteria bacterium RIFCSPHIGHO2_12_FULL_44_17]|uniref:Prepilin-type N-terminal cleavage/methylation domain-containing protein n=3 Tax=Candidatus Colwelliibacteriota TaxID=1817904 RepID=A0A1G1Z472_9BACT|nr:MAG: hypothetical protein A3F24_02995 [Candidatus Colwellbacteria bacterium RIFCSPHIGHO2_12_FULL_44_17]OGY59438.1 MAG: hypothetical protein A3I31_00225 [Candidatus Colwellbacteria bacterium RIFCSPLOWO2_02_FULL_44_20b]
MKSSYTFISKYSRRSKKELVLKKRKRVEGFSLIEMLVILAVVAALSAFLVLYNRTAARQLILNKEQIALIDLTSRARFLSLQTYIQNLGTTPVGKVQICGVGMKIDKTDVDGNGVKNEAFIYRDLVAENETCEIADNYTDFNYGTALIDENGSPIEERLPEEQFSIKLNPLTRFGTTTTETNLDFILFIPPDPQIFINDKNNPASKAEVIIEAADQTGALSNFVKIIINDAGYVSTE